ncbi:Protein CBG09778 [Anopheles sinensis]|uniref:Protein CBG09778 n=1 Tax=Anopheles sinensis TaxID=74873 RepID=A0A084WS70_ANOSI|nr:Protein CBG09778 [Anopheles sinensis]
MARIPTRTRPSRTSRCGSNGTHARMLAEGMHCSSIESGDVDAPDATGRWEDNGGIKSNHKNEIRSMEQTRWVNRRKMEGARGVSLPSRQVPPATSGRETVATGEGFVSFRISFRDYPFPFPVLPEVLWTVSGQLFPLCLYFRLLFSAWLTFVPSPAAIVFASHANVAGRIGNQARVGMTNLDSFPGQLSTLAEC